jgi:hypothetical protein
MSTIDGSISSGDVPRLISATIWADRFGMRGPAVKALVYSILLGGSHC